MVSGDRLSDSGICWKKIDGGRGVAVDGWESRSRSQVGQLNCANANALNPAGALHRSTTRSIFVTGRT